MNEFKKLNISEDILKAIEEKGFSEPTEIQARTIPRILDGKDVMAASATGSGKTLAFGTGLIEGSEPIGKVQAVVLTPTRELAEQIYDSLKYFSKHKNLKIIAVYGGVGINPQIHDLQTTDIVIATPGRMLDHMQRGTIELGNVKYLVLDEADRMLDMGFIDDVRKIMSQLPNGRQTMLFTATLPSEVVEISKKFMNNPEKITVECYVDPKKLNQIYYDVPNNMKFSLLVHLLKQDEMSGLVMVFCNSRKSTDFVAKNLKKQGLEAVGIHGGLTQAKRSDVLQKFNSGKSFILVCTDVAARGLDIPGVTHVYNYDSPDDSKQYIHRIGRTARAGESGQAINLISDRDHENFGRVLWENDIEVKKVERPYIERVQTTDVGSYGRGNARGPRRNNYNNHRGPRNNYNRYNTSSGDSRPKRRSSQQRPRNRGHSNRTRSE